MRLVDIGYTGPTGVQPDNGVSGVAACGGAGRGYDHYAGALRSVP